MRSISENEVNGRKIGHYLNDCSYWEEGVTPNLSSRGTHEWVKSINNDYTIMVKDGMETDEATLARLVSAVSRAAGRPLEFGAREVNIQMNSGCYILNRWGYGPRYEFNRYAGGPFSEDLVDDLMDLGLIDGSVEPTHVPESAISDLKRIFERGPGYTEAYALILVATDVSPMSTTETIRTTMTQFKPKLKDEIEEVMASLGI